MSMRQPRPLRTVTERYPVSSIRNLHRKYTLLVLECGHEVEVDARYSTVAKKRCPRCRK